MFTVSGPSFKFQKEQMVSSNQHLFLTSYKLFNNNKMFNNNKASFKEVGPLGRNRTAE